MAASFVVAAPHLHPMVKVPLARGAIFLFQKSLLLVGLHWGRSQMKCLVVGSYGMGFAMGAWPGCLCHHHVSLKGVGFHLGGLAWVFITFSIFLCFASIITSLSNILAILGHLQGVLHLNCLSGGCTLGVS